MSCNNLAGSAIAFFATRSSDLTTATTIIPFNSTTVNDGQGFDLSTSTFTPPQGGLYWIHWSVGLQSLSSNDVRLDGPVRKPNILRTFNTWSGVDTKSRDEIVLLRALVDQLTLSSDKPLYSDAGVQTSFGGFQLDNVVSPLVAFSVGRTTTLSSAGQMPYDLINKDTNNGWSSNRYLVSITGTWVIFFSIGAPNGGDVHVSLYAPNVVTYLHFGSTNNAGEDTLSKTVVIPVTAGSSIYTYLNDPPVYSDIRYQTALMGFLYAPRLLLPVSWCVASETTYAGTTDPVPFDVVLTNEGNGWNAITNIFTVPVTGVYYIHMTAGIYYPYPTKMELLVNGVVKANVYRSSVTHNNVDTRSRAIILPLNENDQLKIRIPSGYRLYSDGNRYTIFSGFRIY
jgi:hypothetical protein